MVRLAIPALVIYVLPVLAGVLAGKYVGRFANFCVMLATYQVGLFILAFANSGALRARLLIPVIFVWPPLSHGQFIPPLGLSSSRWFLPSSPHRALKGDSSASRTLFADLQADARHNG